MLFYLTGDIQTGKTRWLERMIDELEQANVTVQGVIAPGDWRKAGEGFEKLGIDNVLLPQGERIPFARRRDLAQCDGKGRSTSQSERAQLGWAIDDNAIATVNAHLARIMDGAGCATQPAPNNRLSRKASEPEASPALLVIDEIGRLELECECGLTNAVRLLDRGATESLPHALVIVRSALLDAAKLRFSDTLWNGALEIRPDDRSRCALLDAFGIPT